MSNYQAEYTKAQKRLPIVIEALAQANAELENESKLSSDARIELRQARDNANSEKGQLTREMDRLASLMAQIQAVDSADATVKASRKQIASSQKEQANLEAKREKVSSKLTKLTDDLDQLRAKAADSERLAAEAYAAALASGDAAAEQAAQARLESAGDAIDEAARKTTRQQLMVTALAAELANIDGALLATSEALKVAETDQFTALRLKANAEWDAAVRNLVELGGRVDAVNRLAGWSSTILDGIKIPLLGINHGDPISSRDIDRSSETYSRSDLIGA
jgi:chromosome segregation ATPase